MSILSISLNSGLLVGNLGDLDAANLSIGNDKNTVDYMEYFTYSIKLNINEELRQGREVSIRGFFPKHIYFSLPNVKGAIKSILTMPKNNGTYIEISFMGLNTIESIININIPCMFKEDPGDDLEFKNEVELFIEGSKIESVVAPVIKLNSSLYEYSLFKGDEISVEIRMPKLSGKTLLETYDSNLAPKVIPVENVRVYLYDNSTKQPILSTYSDPNGYYEFSVPRGRYYLSFIVPYENQNDVVKISGGVSRVNSDNGEIDSSIINLENDVEDINFYIAETKYAVNGRVYTDNNMNGKMDPADSPIGGVRIALCIGNKKFITTTNENGEYQFVFDTPGEYEMYFVDIDPCNPGQKLGECGKFILCGKIDEPQNKPQIVVNTHNIGCKIRPSGNPIYSIEGMLFYDEKTAGAPQPRNISLNGIRVQLFDKDDKLVSTRITRRVGRCDGYYKFSKLPVGEYKVKFLLPTILKFTQSTFDEGTSKVDPNTGIATVKIETMSLKSINGGVVSLQE